MSYTATILAEK